MTERAPTFVVAAHPDDWQLFAGASIYKRLQDPAQRVVVILLTAGDAGDDAYHWKARHAGAVFSLVRAMPSWNPYELGPLRNSSAPCALSVAYDIVSHGGKAILRTEVSDTCGTSAEMYSLHLRDGGTGGNGFAPKHESLSTLRAGTSHLSTVWPEDDSVRYGSWSELRDVLAELFRQVIGNHVGEIQIYAPDPDPARNPGDHPDHVCAASLVSELRAEIPALAPLWVAMYDVGNRDENLISPDDHLKRAAIHAYGGAYMAQASGARETWRHGWEREYPVFGKREYVTEEQAQNGNFE